MNESSEIRHGRHCIFGMHVHLVFVTKYRREVFDADAIRRLRRIFAKVCADFEAELIEMDGEGDHVHLLVEYSPKVAVSRLVNSLKGVSSRLLRKERPDIRKHYWRGMLWSPSYFAASCGGRRFLFFGNTSRNKRRQDSIRALCSAILPRLKGRGLPRPLAIVFFLRGRPRPLRRGGTAPAAIRRPPATPPLLSHKV